MQRNLMIVITIVTVILIPATVSTAEAQLIQPPSAQGPSPPPDQPAPTTGSTQLSPGLSQYRRLVVPGAALNEQQQSTLPEQNGRDRRERPAGRLR